MADLETFLYELRRLGDPVSQVRLTAFIRSQLGRQLYFSRKALVVTSRVELASTLLASGMTRADAHRALMARLGVSERTAQRLTADALRLRRLNGR